MQSPEHVRLTLERNKKLEQFMSAPVLATLHANNITLSIAQQQWIRNQIERGYQHCPDMEITTLRIKKIKGEHPYSPWIISDTPYISLPTPAKQKINPKKRKIYSKRMINLLDGSTLRDKVFRPGSEKKPKRMIPLYETWAFTEANNLKILGRTHYITTLTKIVDNLIIPAFHVVHEEAIGEDLLYWINDHSLSLDESLWIFRELCIVTQRMHDEDHVIHLDVKLANIIYNRAPRQIKLVDWESMTAIGAQSSNPVITDRYAHPEVCEAKQIAKEKKSTPIVFGRPEYDVSSIISSMWFLFEHLRARAAANDKIYLFLREMLSFLKEQRNKKNRQELITFDALIPWIDKQIAYYHDHLSQCEAVLVSHSDKRNKEPNTSSSFSSSAVTPDANEKTSTPPPVNKPPAYPLLFSCKDRNEPQNNPRVNRCIIS